MMWLVEIAPIVLVLLVISIVVAALEERLRQLLAQAALVILSVFQTLEQAIQQSLAWLREQVRALLATLGREGVWVGWYVIGALIYLVAFTVAISADFWVTLLTFQAMGLSSGAARAVGGAADVLMTMAFLASAAIFGLLVLDLLEVTHFGPWDRGGPLTRKVFLLLAALGLAGSIAVAALLGLWRGLQIVPAAVGTDEMPAEAMDVMAPLIVSAAIPVLLTLASALTGWAVVTSIGGLSFLMFLSLPIALLGVGILTARMGANLTHRVFSFATAAVSVAAAPGRGVWNWLTGFEPLRETLNLRPIQQARDPDLPTPAMEFRDVQPAPTTLGGNGTGSVSPGALFEGEFVPVAAPSGEGPPGNATGRDEYGDDDPNWNPLGM